MNAKRARNSDPVERQETAAKPREPYLTRQPINRLVVLDEDSNVEPDSIIDDPDYRLNGNRGVKRNKSHNKPSSETPISDPAESDSRVANNFRHMLTMMASFLDEGELVNKIKKFNIPELADFPVHDIINILSSRRSDQVRKEILIKKKAYSVLKKYLVSDSRFELTFCNYSKLFKLILLFKE